MSSKTHKVLEELTVSTSSIRPKLAFLVKEVNSRLDTSGRYTRKIIGVLVLFIFLILYYGSGGSTNSDQNLKNEFRAHAVISMEDHLLRQAILEKERLDAIIPVNQPIYTTNEQDDESETDFTESEELGESYAQPELKYENIETEKTVESEERSEMVANQDINQDEFTPSDADFEFEEFKGPDLSNLPEEIPIPYQEPVLNAYSLDLPQQDNNIELNVVESLGSEEIQHKRQLSVKKACYMPRLRNEVYNQTSRFYNVDDLQPKDFKHFIVDESNKLIYCAISKAGNTNWKKVMAVLGGAINNKSKWNFDDVDDVPGAPGTPIHESWFFKRMDSYSIEEIKTMMNDRYYRKFTFVRDPLSRILSAYLDKFNTENKVVAEYYKRWYGRYIMNTYQGGLPSKENENFKVEWKSFLKYLVDQPDDDLNEHWDRQFTLCHPCHIHFDFVGKIEQADTEAPYMLDRFRFSGVPGVRYAGGKVKDSDKSRATEFYKDVDPEILSAIYKKYYWDFKIFGYSPAYVGHPELDDGIH